MDENEKKLKKELEKTFVKSIFPFGWKYDGNAIGSLLALGQLNAPMAKALCKFADEHKLKLIVTSAKVDRDPEDSDGICKITEWLPNRLSDDAKLINALYVQFDW